MSSAKRVPTATVLNYQDTPEFVEQVAHVVGVGSTLAATLDDGVFMRWAISEAKPDGRWPGTWAAIMCYRDTDLAVLYIIQIPTEAQARKIIDDITKHNDANFGSHTVDIEKKLH